MITRIGAIRKPRTAMARPLVRRRHARGVKVAHEVKVARKVRGAWGLKDARGLKAGRAIFSPHPKAGDADQAGEQRTGKPDAEHQHHAQRRRHAPVEGGAGILGDEIAEQLVAGPAHQSRGDVVTERHDEDEEGAGGDAGQALRHKRSKYQFR